MKDEKISTIRGVALCQCGGSKNKPFCDGTHDTNGFKIKKLGYGTKDRGITMQGKK